MGILTRDEIEIQDWQFKTPEELVNAVKSGKIDLSGELGKLEVRTNSWIQKPEIGNEEQIQKLQVKRFSYLRDIYREFTGEYPPKVNHYSVQQRMLEL